MTPSPEHRRSLPFFSSAGSAPNRHGSRSAATCYFRCGNACDHEVANRSDNEYFGDVAARAISRRSLLQVSGLGALATVTSQVLVAAPAVAEAAAVTAGNRLGFEPVPPNNFDTITVPPGYAWGAVVRWGDPVVVGAPAFDPFNQTPESQALQFGYNNDYVTLKPIDATRALLVVNHEYTDENLMFAGYTGTPTALQKQIAMMAHGISVVVIERGDALGEWRLPASPSTVNRRITVSTEFLVSGPAAGHPLLQTAADPTGTRVLGTVNNCAGGTTPWGTTLHAEENFNGYFDSSGPVDPAYTAAFARYGILTGPGTTRGWSEVDQRFDLAANPNEANRFGWIVELDPYDPTQPPVKRTMLGRFKHEAATTRLADDGRLVAYLGDDERFDYLYKFVSRDKVVSGDDAAARAANRRLLDSGTLYVARFEGDSPPEEIDGTGTLPSDGAFDGTGRWIRLTDDQTSYVEGMTVAEVLINTRLAADTVSPTKMDRPEDVEASPITGRVYMACTNNTSRTILQVDEANPRPNNRHGHVIEMKEKGNNAAARSFAWQILLVCGDPADPATYFAGFDKALVSPISCPDNVAFDPAGNLWISTDGNALGSHDGLFVTPLKGSERGHLKQFMTMPTGAETCGPYITSDARSVFAAVQHPGETTGSTFENPSSTFPDGGVPRPTVVVAWKERGGVIAS